MPNISSWTELNNIRNIEGYLYENWTLVANLKITDADYDGIGNNWSPLGYDYQGTFNGSGHYIEGLSAPLFNSLYASTITFLGLKDVNITTGAALAVGATYCTISNCWVSGSISGSNAGGLVSGTYYANIYNCYSSANISGSGACGGLVGDTIATGITSCFATGTVTGDTVGGLIGTADGAPMNCGWVTSSCAQAIGNLMGGGPASVDYSETSAAPYYSSLHGVYSGWNFTNTWYSSGSALPVLRAIGTTPTTPVLSFGSSTTAVINLVWTESVSVGGEIIGYKIERATPGGAFSVLVANTGTTALTYADSAVTSGQEFQYRVTALSYGEPSAVSNVVRGIATLASLYFLSDGVEIPNGQYQYYGDPNTDGSFRINNASSVLKLQKRITGTWTDTTWSEIDPNSLLLNQAISQTVTGGMPIFDTGIKIQVGGSIPDSSLKSAGDVFSISNTTMFNVKLITASNVDSSCPFLDFEKARGTLIAPTIVSNGDYLGVITAYGYGGTVKKASSAIYFLVDGTTGVADVPGAISFCTAKDGEGYVDERLRISNDGTVKLNKYTTDGFLKVSSSNGTISVDTTTYLTSVTAHNLLSTTHGDTTAGSVARGSIITGQGETPKWTALALPSTPTGKILTATATDVSWSSNPLTIGTNASVSGSNTGDQDLSGLLKTDQTTSQTTVGRFTFPNVVARTDIIIGAQGDGYKLSYGYCEGFTPPYGLTISSVSTNKIFSDGRMSIGDGGEVNFFGSQMFFGFADRTYPTDSAKTSGMYKYNGVLNFWNNIVNQNTISLADNGDIAIGSRSNYGTYSSNGSTSNIPYPVYLNGNTGVNGSTWLGDKLLFTQTDGNEYIDSLNDGYMDYGATTAHRFLADVKLTSDSRKLYFGTADDASIYYDGTNLIINPKEVGTGHLSVLGNTHSSKFVTDSGTSSQFVKGDGTLDSSTYLTSVPTVTYSKSFVLTNPTTSTDGPIWRVPNAITITAIHVLCMDGTSITGQLWEYDANGANGSTVDADITGTAGTNVDDDGALTNPGIAAGNYLGWKTTSVSGSVTKVIVTYDYTVEA